VFSMIIVRISLGLNSTQPTTSVAVSTLFISPPRSALPQLGTLAGSRYRSEDDHGMMPLEVKVAEETLQYSSDGTSKDNGCGLEHDSERDITSGIVA
jgi:hypothetical protein